MTMIAMTMMRPASPPPTPDGTKVVLVSSRPMATRTTCTMPPAREFITPELAATATWRPRFWKNLITSAVVATVPPIRPVKLLANCSASTGPNGSGVATEPCRAIAPVNCGTNETRKAAITQGHWASDSVDARSAPANCSTMK